MIDKIIRKTQFNREKQITKGMYWQFTKRKFKRPVNT